MIIDYFRELGTKQIYITNTTHYEKITEKFNLKKYLSLELPTLFINAFHKDDLDIIKNHKAKKYLLLTLELLEITYLKNNKINESFINFIKKFDCVYIINDDDQIFINNKINFINISKNEYITDFFNQFIKTDMIIQNNMLFSIKYQHDKNMCVTKINYNQIYNYKKELIKNITKLLENLEIKFCISHGNLIEYERNMPIYHDDDLDIRFCINDIKKWEFYCKTITDNKDEKFNLKYDDRIKDINKQLYNGIQIMLIDTKCEGIFNNEIDIHADFVCNIVENKFWLDYNIDFCDLRKIKLYDIEAYAPSKHDTKKVLEKQYGENYILPNYIYKII